MLHPSCDKCHYTGYKGRVALYEIIPIDQELAACIKTNDHDITNKLKQRNIQSLSQRAYQIFMDGKTSLEEVYPLLTGF